METLAPVRIPPDPRRVLLRTWSAHSNFIQGLALSPDGRRIYTASEDGGLCCWDFQTGAQIRAFTGHRGPVNHIALTPDGRRMVSAGDDRTLRVWDTETGKTLRVLRGHTGYVSKVGIATQGDRLVAVSSSKDTTLRVWDLQTFACLHLLEGHTEWASSLAVSPDGTRAASGSPARELKVWDLVRGEALDPLMEPGSTGVHWLGKRGGLFVRTGEAKGPGHSGDPEAMAFLAGQEKLVSVEAEILVWDLASRTCQAISPKSHFSYEALALFRDGVRVAVAAHSLEIWDLQTGRRLALQTSKHGLKSVALTPDEAHLVTADAKGNVAVWDVADMLRIGEPEGHFSYTKSVALSGELVLTSGADKRVIFWDTRTGLPTKTLTLKAQYVTLHGFLRDGVRFLTVDEAIMADDHLRLWRTDQDTPLLSVPIPREPQLVLPSPDESVLFCFDYDGAYTVDLSTGERTPWSGKAEYVKSAAWDSTGKWVLSSNHYRNPAAVPLWSRAGKKRAKTYTIDKGRYGHSNFVAFSPDEQAIIAGWNDARIYTWNRKNRKLIKSWESGHHHLSDLFISAAGELITFCSRGPLRRWSLDGTLIGEIPVPWASAGKATFSEDRSLLMAVWEGTGWVIRVEDGTVVATFTVPEGLSLYQAALSDDGRTVVFGLDHGSTLIFRPITAAAGG